MHPHILAQVQVQKLAEYKGSYSPDTHKSLSWFFGLDQFKMSVRDVLREEK